MHAAALGLKCARSGVESLETAFALFTAGLASLAIVPLMIRLAPRLGMVDQPAERKVHSYPIPRVGGWGIAAGVVSAILVWAPNDPIVVVFIWSILVLFVFGAWDDRRELGHYVKFAGQALAVLPMVVLAGLYVTRFPFIDDASVPTGIAMAFSAFALVGMTNAINHSDGLDGLAGGEAILSLVAMGFLAHQAGGGLAVLIAVAVIGAVFGFLRYNTHPAVVFMGDSGSQVIGFSLGMLAVLLVERVDPTLSPAVAVLLLGLPVADILYVLYRRIRQHGNWFRATKNHVHHRLLERRFTHPEAVVIIYGIQILFVVSGVVLRHESDWLLAGIYLFGCTVVFGGLYLAEKFDWYAPARGQERGMWRWLGRGTRRKFLLIEAPRRVLEIAVPGYLVVASFRVSDVPLAAGATAVAVLAVFAVLGLGAIKPGARDMIRRGAIFSVVGLVVYLTLGHGAVSEGWLQTAEQIYFVVIALMIGIAVRYSPTRRHAEFRTTGMDYLIWLAVVVVAVAAGPVFRQPAWFVVALLVLLYATELMITERRETRQILVPAALVSLGILTIKAFALGAA